MNYVLPQDIKKIRSRMGLNHSNFARAVGVSGGQVIKSWETGKTSPKGKNYETLMELNRRFNSNGDGQKFEGEFTPPQRQSDMSELKEIQFILKTVKGARNISKDALDLLISKLADLR